MMSARRSITPAAMVTRALAISTRQIFQHHHGDIIPATLVVTVEHPCDQPGMPDHESGVVCGGPTGRQPVAVENQQGARREAKLEFLYPAHDMSQRPAV